MFLTSEGGILKWTHFSFNFDTFPFSVLPNSYFNDIIVKAKDSCNPPKQVANTQEHFPIIHVPQWDCSLAYTDGAILQESHEKPPSDLYKINRESCLHRNNVATIKSADCGHPEIKTKYKLQHIESSWLGRGWKEKHPQLIKLNFILAKELKKTLQLSCWLLWQLQNHFEKMWGILRAWIEQVSPSLMTVICFSTKWQWQG